MGRASRWLANLFGMRKSDSSEPKPKKWRFGKSYREKKEKGGAPPQAKAEVAPEKRAPYRQFVDADEDSKRAMAVAAATSEVAQKALAAHQAAAVVVKLTSGGRMVVGGGGRKEEWAAVKIQSVFRGYLV